MDDDSITITDGPCTVISLSYGELDCTVSVATNLSPDAIDTTLNDVRKQLVAAVRQLDLVAPVTDGDT